jgi:photosystem II stability/assembly factor-like uncharacterized protein
MSPPAAAPRRLAQLALLLAAGLTSAAEPASFSPRLLEPLTARPIGPANMSGRVTAIAVVENKPATMFVAAASGGLWKTVNNGITWTPVFDEQPVASLGDVAVAPSNPDVVWVGTGESNARNSVSWGDGAYKSTDAGKTWKHVGLKETDYVGRIAIHPKNPDIVYVAAMGRFWGPNKERGIYKTLDGGKSWEQVKFLNEDTGFIDLVMDPADPETLYAAAYPVRRDAFSGGNPATMTGPEGGLYKSTDGGKSWNKLTNGLPDRPIGRCGLAVCRKDPRLVYAVVQTDRTAVRNVPGQAEGNSGKVETGGVFRSDDRGETWTKVNDLCPRPFYFGQIRVDPNNPQRVYVLGITLHVSTDGGKTFRADSAPGVHSDLHALWIDPADSRHLVSGSDGGLFLSYDRSAHWEHLKNLPISQFYGVAVDMRQPYRVYGGLQDNGTWGGPSRTYNREGITICDWFRVYGADGFQCQVDPTDADTVYAEWQYGRLLRLNVRTGEENDIQPKAAKGEPAYRFNWNAPVLLSPHNPRTLFFAGNHVFRSVDRGAVWEVISPDLTRGKPGPSPHTGHTITALAQSPLKAGILYAGTDDGRIHVTRDGGSSWKDVSDSVPLTLPSHPAGGEGKPGKPSPPADGGEGKVRGTADSWVTRIEASHFAEGTAYLALDRHRHEDRAPYVFRTEDYGATWKPLANNLPAGGPVHVIREDPRNRDLLYVGTEFGLFVSLDRGASWLPLRNGLPTVPVHDLVIHPRDRELVVGTHGRGIYVIDVAPLQELTAKVRAEPAHLFDVKPALVFHFRGARGMGVGKNYIAPNPPYGAAIYYYLKDKAMEDVRVTVSDPLGNPVAILQGPGEAGLHQVQWNLLGRASIVPPRAATSVPPGDYVVRVKIGDQVLAKKVRVEAEE